MRDVVTREWHFRHDAGRPFAETSAEFFPPFRAREVAVFDRLLGIVVSGEERLVKPPAPIHRLALERFGLRAEEAVFVDDMEANVAGAAAVGMTAIRFTDAANLRTERVRLALAASP